MITSNLKEILDNLSDGIYIVDKNRIIHYWSRAAEDLTGYCSEELLGKHCSDSILAHVDKDGNSLCKNGCPLVKTIKDEEIKESKVFFHHKDGYLVPAMIKALPYKNKAGEIIGAIEIFNDNSERKNILKKMRELKELAVLDDLTQLPNRRYIESSLEAKLNEFQENNIKFGLIFMDIDHFKKFNDVYGHIVGDLVLETISTTFSNNLRGDDIIGRWGGEEFIGIISVIDEKELGKVAEKLRRLLEKTIIKADGEYLNVTISCGATLVRIGDDITMLVARADELLYKSKGSGRNCVTIG